MGSYFLLRIVVSLEELMLWIALTLDEINPWLINQGNILILRARLNQNVIDLIAYKGAAHGNECRLLLLQQCLPDSRHVLGLMLCIGQGAVGNAIERHSFFWIEADFST